MSKYTAEQVDNMSTEIFGGDVAREVRQCCAKMLDDYATLLRERESANPAAWLADDGTGRVIDVKAKVSGSRAAATGSAVAAYSIPLFAHPERESAKVGVTPQSVEVACRVAAAIVDHRVWTDEYDAAEQLECRKVTRAILEAVAPMQTRVDVETMLKDCVPGGSIVDPQLVCDNIREWFANKPNVASGLTVTHS